MADQRVTIEDGKVDEAEHHDSIADARHARLDSKERLIREVRATDIEPYTGLRYLSTLFKVLAVILLVLLVAEVITGLYTQGTAAIPTLLGEASRLIVLAGVLWGTGDLAHLLIDVGHDVRAARIMAARVAHVGKVPPSTPRPVERTRGDLTRSERQRARENVVDRAKGSEGPPIP